MDKLETGTFNVGFDDEKLISKIEEISPKDMPEASEDESDDNEDDDDVFPEEFDDKVRSCKVCLRLEPALNHSGAKVILASKSLKHWAIVCDFKGRKIQYDLFNASGKLSGGEICPRWTDLGHETKNCLTTTYVLGKIIDMSKKRLQIGWISCNEWRDLPCNCSKLPIMGLGPLEKFGSGSLPKG